MDSIYHTELSSHLPNTSAPPPPQLFFLASSLFKVQRPLNGYTVKTVFRYIRPFRRAHSVH